jgi:hypothetical protein
MPAAISADRDRIDEGSAGLMAAAVVVHLPHHIAQSAELRRAEPVADGVGRIGGRRPSTRTLLELGGLVGAA